MALLFSIDWPEPFGLVQIEAMARGAPVIAWRKGSVAEVVEHGVTGYIVNGLEEAAAAVEKACSLSREGVRRGFEKRFTVERAARDYVRVYDCLRARTLSARPRRRTTRRACQGAPLRLLRTIRPTAANARRRARLGGDFDVTNANFAGLGARERSVAAPPSIPFNYPVLHPGEAPVSVMSCAVSDT